MSFDQISKNLHSELLIVQQTVKLNELAALFQKYFQSSYIEYSPEILQAFVHKSFTHEFKMELDHNEKLEFLGDAVLQMIISEKLFMKYPNKDEGELSKMRSAIVNENTLAILATELGLAKYIMLGRGELKEAGHEKSSILANTFEAVLGAIYLKNGMSDAIRLMETAMAIYQESTGKELLAESILLSFDPKTKLQEIVMKKYKTTPSYTCLSVKEGKKERFKVELRIEDKLIDSLMHISKKKGMQQLAKQVLEKELI